MNIIENEPSVHSKLKKFFNFNDTSHFIAVLTIFTMILRMLSVLFLFLYPDSENIIDIPGLNIYDANWYLQIARYGYFPSQDFPPDYHAGEFGLIAFAPLFPAILSIAVFLFQDYSPFIVNSCFIALTPLFIIKFLRNIIVDENTIHKIAIVIMFNPLFWGYSLFGLSEPLNFLLLFIVLTVHYKPGNVYRILEYALLICLILSHFTFLIFTIFYLFKAIFTRKTSMLKRVSIAFPSVILLFAFLAWNVACSIVFDHIPSEAEKEYWRMGLNLNLLSPAFLMQIPVLAIGMILGIAVLTAALSRDQQKTQTESARYNRLEVHALLAFASVTIIFFGLLNFNLALLRFTSLLFPIYMIVFLPLPTSKFLKRSMLGYIWGLIAFYIIAVIYASIFLNNLWFTAEINGQVRRIGHVSFFLADSICIAAFGIIYLALSAKLMTKWYESITISRLVILQALCAILIIPLVLKFP